MTTTATTEPTELRAGDTWRWLKDLSDDYPADAWSLVYRFVNSSAAFEIVAGTSTDAPAVFDVSQAAAVTAARSAGTYYWASRVTQGTGTDAVAHSVGTGTTELLPDLFSGTAAASDQRTHAQKVLAALESLIEGRAASDVAAYSIGGRSLTKMRIDELLAWRAKYQQMVAAEGGRTMKAYARFTDA